MTNLKKEKAEKNHLLKNWLKYPFLFPNHYPSFGPPDKVCPKKIQLHY